MVGTPSDDDGSAPHFGKKAITVTQRSLRRDLTESGPKRVLALDGGGIRGMLTLSFLSRIETLLRERYGRSNFLLSDYFDLIGGTSTGSIIAAGLATGHSVRELQDLYDKLASDVFKKPFWRRGLFFPKYSSRRLRELLVTTFGGVKLGDDKIRTGLAIVTKRLDTANPWVLTNFGKYFDLRDVGGVGNIDLPLSNLVLASTAAPTFFPKVTDTLASTHRGHVVELVDGGVTPYNNPAFRLLMIATLKGFGLEWQLGGDNLFIVSVGTGLSFKRTSLGRFIRAFALTDAARSLVQLLDDCNDLNETIMQWFSRTDTARHIDHEIGDLREDLPGDRELISYARYNVVLETHWLERQLGFKLSQREADRLSEMDNPNNVKALRQLGDTAAALMVQTDHFPSSFDLREETIAD